MSECVQLEGLGYYLKVKIQTSSFYIVMKARSINNHYMLSGLVFEPVLNILTTFDLQICLTCPFSSSCL